MRSAIVLCSGGIDSVVTAYYVKNSLKYKKIIIIFFNYGQKSLIQERIASRICASRLNAKFIEINLSELSRISTSLINKSGKTNNISIKDLKDTRKESKKWYVPQRNLIFITYALALADSLYTKYNDKYAIFLGFKSEGKDPYPDTTEEFISSVNKLSNIASVSKSKISAPLIRKDKEDIIELGNNLGVDFTHTFSCYVGKRTHCGTCLACRLRQEGFYWANMQDPTKYEKKMKDFRA